MVTEDLRAGGAAIHQPVASRAAVLAAALAVEWADLLVDRREALVSMVVLRAATVRVIRQAETRRPGALIRPPRRTVHRKMT